VALFDPRTLDSDGNGTADLDITAGGLGGLHGDGSNVQRLAIFPGGYTGRSVRLYERYVFENNSATGYGAFYPVVSDPNYGVLTSPPLYRSRDIDLQVERRLLRKVLVRRQVHLSGLSVHKHRNGWVHMVYRRSPDLDDRLKLLECSRPGLSPGKP